MRVPVDDADHKGRTAAHFAVLRDHPAALNALLEAGADVDRPCAAGDTPLHLAASRPNCVEVRGKPPGASPNRERGHSTTESGEQWSDSRVVAIRGPYWLGIKVKDEL